MIRDYREIKNHIEQSLVSLSGYVYHLSDQGIDDFLAGKKLFTQIYLPQYEIQTTPDPDPKNNFLRLFIGADS